MVVARLLSAGDQVPVIPLVDVNGNGLRTVPAQIAATTANVGVTEGLTVMVKVVDTAHWPVLGVKV